MIQKEPPHLFFVGKIADAYICHLMATNRRPVYRYETGDLEVDRCFLMGLLDGYLSERKPEGWRAKFYISMLQKDFFTRKPDPRAIYSPGKTPLLNRRGVKYMNALLHQYGDMLEDIGVKDADGMFQLPKNYGERVSA